MKHERQTGPSCLGHALWSIGAIDKATRDEYAEHVAPYVRTAEEQIGWVRSVAPWAEGVLTSAIGSSSKSADMLAGASPVIPSKGSGVLSVRLFATRDGEESNNHAMAYSDGMLMDSDSDYGKPETWKHFSARVMREHGLRAVLLGVAPRKRSRKA